MQLPTLLTEGGGGSMRVKILSRDVPVLWFKKSGLHASTTVFVRSVWTRNIYPLQGGARVWQNMVNLGAFKAFWTVDNQLRCSFVHAGTTADDASTHDVLTQPTSDSSCSSIKRAANWKRHRGSRSFLSSPAVNNASVTYTIPCLLPYNYFRTAPPLPKPLDCVIRSWLKCDVVAFFISTGHCWWTLFIDTDLWQWSCHRLHISSYLVHMFHDVPDRGGLPGTKNLYFLPVSWSRVIRMLPA